VHRAEIMQLRGSWREALEEAERAIKRSLEGENPRAAGEAAYRKGEIHRLMGDFDAAEAAYRDASERGWDPQPGFALLRLAQGNTDAAEAAIRRAGSEAVEPARRASLLPAFAEVMTSVDDNGAARAACDELDAFAGDDASEALAATAAQTRGVVELSDGDAGTALRSLRRAAAGWQELGAPYQAARAGELIALACRELGDEDAALLELGAARAAFARLGARPDLARIEALAELAAAFDTHGLTERELEVLRHLAAGETNRAIATQLVLSVRTIDRHVSNIYAKLGVSSRAAATAHAHQHGLL
jgi:DNA-binding NarL/FixJ family response regulator